MTLVPASSHGSTFNGGTITQPLVIAPTDNTAIPLEIDLPVGAAANGSSALLITSHDLAGDTNLHNFNVYGGYTALTDPALGGRLIIGNVSGVGRFLLDPNNDSQFKTAAGKIFYLRDHSANQRIAAGDDGISFFGNIPVAQQNLTSATATPEQIALALEAATLMGGT